MPTNSLTQEISTVPGFNYTNVQVVQISTAVSLQPIVQMSPAYAIARKPAGSAAAFSTATVTPDLAGLYQLTLTNGGLNFTFWLVALSAAALTRFGVGPIAALLSMNMGNWSATTFAASVEQGSPGAFLGLDARLFGGAVANPINWPQYP